VSGAALGLVLGAAVLHAGWNVLLHSEGDRVPTMAVAGLVGGAILLPFAIADPPTEVAGLVVLTGFAEAAYALALSAAYARGSLSLVYPVGRGTAPLLATLGAWMVLSEVPGIAGLLGAALLAGGLLLLRLEAQRTSMLPALGFALLVGVTIATYSVIDAFAVRETAPLGYLSLGLLVMGILLSSVLRFDGARLRSALRPGAVIGLGVVGAYGMVLFAFRLADVNAVTTLRETSVLFGILLAREHPSARTWAGAGLVVVGAVLAAI
jgi:drug/metabolite transporter (DMT)-like permease